MMKRALLPFWALLLGLTFVMAAPTNAIAQDTGAESTAEAPPELTPKERAAQALADIMARQKGEDVPEREAPAFGNQSGEGLPSMTNQLGLRGGASDADLFRQLKYGEGNVTVSTGKQVDAVLIQDGGMKWFENRTGPLAKFGAYLLGIVLLLLAFFLFLRGRIKIAAGPSAGEKMKRFGFLERCAHWVMAISFILLGITGLVQFFGRKYLLGTVGAENFSWLLITGKWIHNSFAWGFMLSIIVILVLWIWHNIPTWLDVKWFAKGGGIIGDGHPSARKFNGGQKIIFWSVIILGFSISASGISLLFPFEYPMFAKTFGWLNTMGGWVGMSPDLPTTLAPQAEMQLAQTWHAIVAFVFIAIILAHIYIGTVGMQGAFSAMGSGKVDRNWAHEHHNLWAEKMEAKERKKADKWAARTAKSKADQTPPKTTPQTAAE